MSTILVTGANRGIGREVARQLAQKGWRVYLGARDRQKGRDAAETLGVEFLPMDVRDPASIATAAEILREAGGLDVLVNNAGMIAKGDDSVLTVAREAVEETLTTNALGPLALSQALVPLLRKSRRPRIINVSSGGGQMEDGMGEWSPAYCLSKTALNAVTGLLAAALPRFAVNAVCPGWVRTDMGGAGAPRSVKEGADTIVWLAIEAPQSLTGKFLRDREVIPW